MDENIQDLLKLDQGETHSLRKKSLKIINLLEKMHVPPTEDEHHRLERAIRDYKDFHRTALLDKFDHILLKTGNQNLNTDTLIKRINKINDDKINVMKKIIWDKAHVHTKSKDLYFKSYVQNLDSFKAMLENVFPDGTTEEYEKLHALIIDIEYLEVKKPNNFEAESKMINEEF